MRCIGKAASTNAKRKQCDVSGREMITTNVNQQQPDLRPARCFASKVQLRGLQIRSPAVVGAREGGGADWKCSFGDRLFFPFVSLCRSLHRFRMQSSNTIYPFVKGANVRVKVASCGEIDLREAQPETSSSNTSSSHQQLKVQ